MNSKFLFFFLLGLHVFFIKVSAQQIATTATVNNIDSSISNSNPLTIVYDIQVKTDKKKTGIEETYNGGIQTIFINNEQARIRLVSLMRIQSIFFSSSNSNHQVSIVKESGKTRYKYYLTNDQWNLVNSKYDNDSCQLTNDSAMILSYACRKAVIILKDGRTITVFYTNQLKPVSSKIEPAFSCVPGLVLQYEYSYKKGTTIYTASKISQDPIAENVFKIPIKGYAIKKYCLKCTTKESRVSTNSDVD